MSEQKPGENSSQASDGSPGGAGKHLLFVWKPTGYELAERAGEPPSVGEDVEHEEQRFRVSKLGPSPLPGDDRVCAYLQG